ncbi:probable calcium-binding protein CML50, partial [Morus notabilis]
MASFERYGSQSYAPSAPTLPEDHNYTSTTTTTTPPPNSHGHDHTQFHSHGSSPSSYAYGQSSSSSHGYGQSSSSPYGYGQMGSTSSFSSSYGYGYVGFPAGTSPDVIRSFEMVDRDRSGFIDDNELQQALSSGYQKFSLRTIRLLISLFKNPNDPAPRI